MADHPHLKCSISSAQRHVLGAAVDVEVSITASEEDIALLPWGTPFDELENDAFEVIFDGRTLEYDGVRVKRGGLTPEDYIVVPAGETMRQTVDLTQAYPFEHSGRYQLRLRAHGQIVVGGTSGPTPESARDVLMESEAIDIELVGDGPPRETTGRLARQADHGTAFELLGGADVLSLPWQPRAPTIEGGTTAQRAAVMAAHNGAFSLAHSALDLMVEPAPVTYWFGSIPPLYETVKRTLTEIVGLLGNITVTYVVGGPLCKTNIFAYTYYGVPKIWLCAMFFSAGYSGLDSQIGVVIHESSHVISGTNDTCYGPQEAAKLAASEPELAVRNADNYEYYSENLWTVIWQPAIGSMLQNAVMPSVALNNQGEIILLCRLASENVLCCWQGRLSENQGITVVATANYDKGDQVAVAMNGDVVVDLHIGQGGDGHFYLVGDSSSGAVKWPSGGGTKYDKGGQISAAMDTTRVFDFHESGKQSHYYWVGVLTGSPANAIKWSSEGPVKYDTGAQIAVATDQRGNLIEVHRGPENSQDHFVSVGTLLPDGVSIKWGVLGQRYDKGDGPVTVTSDQRGHFVEVHRTRDDGWFHAGFWTGTSVQVRPSLQFATGLYQGAPPSVAIDGAGNVVLALELAGKQITCQRGLLNLPTIQIEDMV